MKVLIAGGGGYIGSHLAWYLLKAGHVPVVFDNWSSGRSSRVEGIDAVPGNAANIHSTLSVFENFRFDALVYAIAPPRVRPPRVWSVDDVFPVHVPASVVLSNLCSRFSVKRVVFLSSASVYGETTEQGAGEADSAVLSPFTAEGKALSCCEEIFNAYCEQGLFSLTILRLFTVAGAAFDRKTGDHPDTSFQLLPSALQALKSGGPFQLCSSHPETPDGSAVRDYVHLHDVSEAVRLTLECPFSNTPNIYNVSSGYGRSAKEVITEVEKCVGETLSVTFKEVKEKQAPFLIGKNTKITEELGWEPRFSSLEEMVASQWDYMLHQVEADSIEESGFQVQDEGAELFGEMAVKLGFATEADIKQALKIQQHDITNGRPHRLIGLVMLEEGMIDNAQLIELLKYYEHDLQG